MRQGSGTAVAVFAGVLFVTGGLAFVLYQAGESEPAGTEGLEPARRVPKTRERLAPEPATEEPLPPPPHLQPPRKLVGDAKARFDVPGHEDVGLRDWKEVVDAYRGMREVFRTMAERGPPRPDDDFEPFRVAGERLDKAAFRPPPGHPLGKPVTAMDHPAFAANLVAAVLDREKLPLSDAQTRRLADLARERSVSVDRAEETAQQDDGTSYLLQRIAARARVYEEFYGELYSMLTPAQAEAFSPSEFRHRLRIDLASPAIAWRRAARPFFVEGESQLVERLTHMLAMQFDASARRDEVRAIVEAWVKTDSIPAADAFDAKGFVRCSLVAAAVPRMQDLLRRVVEGLKLEGAAAESARLTPEALVPLRR